METRLDWQAPVRQCGSLFPSVKATVTTLGKPTHSTIALFLLQISTSLLVVQVASRAHATLARFNNTFRVRTRVAIVTILPKEDPASFFVLIQIKP